MVTLTPDMAGNTIIVAGIAYLVTFAYSLYMAYVGWKQARVNKQMDEAIRILKAMNLDTTKQLREVTEILKQIRDKGNET